MSQDDSHNDSDLPPSGHDPRRRSYGDLSELRELVAIVDRQNVVLRQEQAARREREVERRRQDDRQEALITSLTNGLGDLRLALTADVADMKRTDKRLEEVERALDVIEKGRERLEGALATIKWLVPSSAVFASFITWALSHIK